MPSNIRANVQWKDSTVFAGEDVECVITFTNIARRDAEKGNRSRRGSTQPSRLDSARPRPERQRTATQSTVFTKPMSRVPSTTSLRTAPQTRGHRPNLSLNVVPSPTHSRAPSTGSTLPTSGARALPNHGRSLSIMSLASDTQSPNAQRKPSIGATPRSGGGHGRSSSMQFMTRGPAQVSPPLGP